MRVIAGRARSLKLKTPEGLNTRPTTDRIKETLFNMIQQEIPNCIFVDLFAGSGGIGIEALSRGASHAYFVENSREAISCIQDNLSFTKFTDSATLLKQEVFSALSMIHEREVDIIFMDPPYGMEHEKRVLEKLKGTSLVSEDTLIIVEADLSTKFDYLNDLGYEMIRYKKYKTNAHIFITSID